MKRLVIVGVAALALSWFGPAEAQEAPAMCSDVCACVGTDLVCCAETPEGETPVLSDLQNDGEICGCAGLPTGGLIAGRISSDNLIGGCSNLGATTVVVPDPQADCVETAVAACNSGPASCKNVITNAPECS